MCVRGGVGGIDPKAILYKKFLSCHAAGRNCGQSRGHKIFFFPSFFFFRGKENSKNNIGGGGGE